MAKNGPPGWAEIAGFHSNANGAVGGITAGAHTAPAVAENPQPISDAPKPGGGNSVHTEYSSAGVISLFATSELTCSEKGGLAFTGVFGAANAALLKMPNSIKSTTRILPLDRLGFDPVICSSWNVYER